jgi:hypothetical protein
VVEVARQQIGAADVDLLLPSLANQ